MKIPYRLRQLSKVLNKIPVLAGDRPAHKSHSTVVVYLTLYWEGVPLEILENVANQNT